MERVKIFGLGSEEFDDEAAKAATLKLNEQEIMERIVNSVKLPLTMRVALLSNTKLGERFVDILLRIQEVDYNREEGINEEMRWLYDEMEGFLMDVVPDNSSLFRYGKMITRPRPVCTSLTHKELLLKMPLFEKKEKRDCD